jgi:DNA-binding NarL/FixJ family response regulator
LSDREIEVTKYLIQGLSNKEICNITNLHSATIGTVKSRIFAKLNVNNIIALKELTRQQGFE